MGVASAMAGEGYRKLSRRDEAGPLNAGTTGEFREVTTGAQSGAGMPKNPHQFGYNYRLSMPDGGTYVFDSKTGQMLSYTDPRKNRLVFNGDSVASISPSGQVVDSITIHRDALNRIDAITDFSGKSIRYDYDLATGDLASVTNRAFETTSFEYDTAISHRAHFLTGIVDARGVKVLSAVFDPATGQLAGLADAAGQSAGFSYSFDLGDGRSVERANDANGPTGGRTEIVHDRAGDVERRVQLVDNTGNPGTNRYLVTVYRYGSKHRQTAASVPFEVIGDLLRFTTGQDLVDDPTAAGFDASVWATRSTYNDKGYLTSTTDALGHATYFSDFDSFGNPATIIDPLQRKTKNTYVNGLLTETIGAEGNITRFEYEGGLLSKVKQVLNGVEITVSDSHYTKGLLDSVTDAAGFKQSFTYDGQNQLATSSYVWVDPTNPAVTKVITTVTDRDEEGRVKGTHQLVDGQELWHTTSEYTDGLLTATVDRFGIRTENIYDARGNLIETRTQSKTALGAPTWIVSRTVYDNNGRAIYAVDAHEESDPDVTFVTAPGTHTIYDDAGRVVRSERLASLQVSLGDDPRQTDSRFKIAEATTVGTVLTFDETFYDAAGQVDHTRQSDGTHILVTKNVYDAADRVTSSIQDLDDDLATPADQIITRFDYDDAGQQTSITDALGHTTYYEYDKLGRQTAVIQPEVIDPQSSAVVHKHLRSETVYDSLGRKTQTIENITQTTPGNAATIDRSHERITTYEYDSAGRLVAVNLPLVTIANPQGRGTISVHPRYEYLYDERGNQVRTTTNAYLTENGVTVVYLQKDASGADVVSATRPFGGPLPNATSTTSTVFTFDELNRQIGRQLPLGVIAGGGFRETQEYNPLGQLFHAVDFEGHHTAFTYDSLGRLDRKLFFSDLIAYSAWLANPAANDPQEFVAYTYDALGREMVVAQDDDGHAYTPVDRVTASAYDAFGRLEQVASPEGTLHYEYDAAGRETRTYTGLADSSHSSTASDGKAVTDTRYDYDTQGRLKTVRVVERNDSPLASPEVTTYIYDAVGNLDTVSLPDGVLSDYDYDELNRLTSVTHTHTSDSTVLARYSYDLFDDGKRKSEVQTTADGTRRFDWVYDNLGRLTEEKFDGPGTDLDYTSDYAFDLVGNRLAKTTDRGSDNVVDEAISYIYDNNDRMLSEALVDQNGAANDRFTEYEYGAGNLATYETAKTVRQGSTTSSTIVESTSYVYNLQGRMSRALVDQGGDGIGFTRLDYTYDADGIRVSQTQTTDTDNDGSLADETPSVSKYVNDHQNPTGYSQVLEEKSSSGSVTTCYTIGLDVAAQADASGNVLFLLKDGHGSTRQLVGPTGQLIAGQSFTYKAFGEAHGFDPGQALTTHLYNGEVLDIESGLQYLRARYYDPSNGRFTSLDSFAGNSDDPQSLHKYLYVQADPVMGIDPTGMFEGGIAGTFAGLGIATSVQNIKISADMAAFEAALTTIAGVQAGQSAEEILATFLENQAIGFGIGFAVGKAIKIGSSLYENGIVIAPARSFASGGVQRPIAIVHNDRFAFPRSDQYQSPRAPEATLPVNEARLAQFNPAQRARAEQWVKWGRGSIGVTDMRLNQAQNNAQGMQVSRNRPDLQFRLEGGRSYELPNGAIIDVPQGQSRQLYIELDPFSGGLSSQHVRNLLGDNPQGIAILDVFDEGGLASTVTLNPL